MTEHRRVDVPVTREEVRVEHVPAGEDRPAVPEGSFERRTDGPGPPVRRDEP